MLPVWLWRMPHSRRGRHGPSCYVRVSAVRRRGRHGPSCCVCVSSPQERTSREPLLHQSVSSPQERTSRATLLRQSVSSLHYANILRTDDLRCSLLQIGVTFRGSTSCCSLWLMLIVWTDRSTTPVFCSSFYGSQYMQEVHGWNSFVSFGRLNCLAIECYEVGGGGLLIAYLVVVADRMPYLRNCTSIFQSESC